MARGGFGGFPNGMNINNLMKQAQKMQKQMEEVQSQLEEKDFEATSGGGAVKVIVTGKKEIKKIEISPDVVDSEDVEMLEDLILTAVNEALRKSTEVSNSEIGKLTGGLGLNGNLF